MEGSVNGLDLVWEAGAGGAAILRIKARGHTAVLPEELLGLPVTALGNRALAPDRQTAPLPAGAETLQITCIPPEEGAAWDNRSLRDLTLPQTLKAVGDYALLNCSALSTLRIHDGVSRWGGGQYQHTWYGSKTPAKHGEAANQGTCG